MKLQDLHLLPKLRDSLSFLYLEHCRIDRDDKAIAAHDAEGKTPIPAASLAALMLGPGTSITHAAVQSLADNGCLILWTGEGAVRLYAQGMGETRSSHRLLHQARLASDPELRLQVVRRLYAMRFPDPLEPGLELQQIRGKEGIRVREAYAAASRETGVAWSGRSYKQKDWGSADRVNRALSTANSCLYGVCHAAILSAGYSPAVGFIHTGKMLSFVYDVGDLYKADLTIPLAFKAAAQADDQLETRVRRACRDAFVKERLLQRIIPDLDRALSVSPLPPEGDPGFDESEAWPGGLWDPRAGEVTGGINHGDILLEEVP